MTAIKFVLPLFIFLSLVFIPVVSAASPTTQNRLSEVRLKVCQKKELAITARVNRLFNLASNMEEVFASHSARVQDYYNQKVVPSGKTAANYSALVSDIAAKKSSVDAALSVARTRVSGFSCTGENPKSKLTDFRQDMQHVKAALQDYRTSVKNLIVAVRSAKSI